MLRVNWEQLSYERDFIPLISTFVRLYFGDNLQTEQGRTRFDFYFDGAQALAVDFKSSRVSDIRFGQFASAIIEKKIPAGLIVSYSESPFRIMWFHGTDGGSIPVASWGRRQVSAILSLNRASVSEFTPHIDYSPEGGSSILGPGSCLWSDVVEFVSLTNQIADNIRCSPTSVRSSLLSGIRGCFERAGESYVTHRSKVGGDGWYHFFESTSTKNPVELGKNAQSEIADFASKWYSDYRLRVSMCAHTVSSCCIDEGAPIDNDSIIACRIASSVYDHYLRSTQEAFTSFVSTSEKSDWTNLGSYDWQKRRTLTIYGNKSWR